MRESPCPHHTRSATLQCTALLQEEEEERRVVRVREPAGRTQGARHEPTRGAEDADSTGRGDRPHDVADILESRTFLLLGVENGEMSLSPSCKRKPPNTRETKKKKTYGRAGQCAPAAERLHRPCVFAHSHRSTQPHRPSWLSERRVREGRWKREGVLWRVFSPQASSEP